MTIPSRRPRVWLIDFETAIEFPEDCPWEECLVTGPPTGGSVTSNERDCPAEVLSGKPYDPFKLDVWQFGYSIRSYKVIFFSNDNH